MTILEQFAKSIERFEGYKIGSLAWRLNNPGALRWSPFQDGQRGGFAYFNSYQKGFGALVWDAKNKMLGNTRTGLGPEKTILEFFQVWAPSSDGNHPHKYAEFVAQQCGLSVLSKLKDVYPNGKIEEVHPLVPVVENPIQNILVVMLNFSGDLEERPVIQGTQEIEAWFNRLGVPTHLMQVSMKRELQFTKVTGLAGQFYESKEVRVIDPEFLKQNFAGEMAGYHFACFVYATSEANKTPAEFSELVNGTVVTQLPVLKVSDASWVAAFFAHELMHGWYFRAACAQLPVKDDVHARWYKDSRPYASYDEIVKNLAPQAGLIFSDKLQTYVAIQQKISMIQRAINVIKSIIPLLTRGV